MGFNARTHPVTVNWTAYPIATTQITADTTWAIYKAPFACQVIDAGFVQVEDEIAKSATNHLIAYILNGGTAGTGTSVIGTATIGKTATAAAYSIHSATTTTTYAKLDAGDYLTAKFDEQGTLTFAGGVRGQVTIIEGYQS